MAGEPVELVAERAAGADPGRASAAQLIKEGLRVLAATAAVGLVVGGLVGGGLGRLAMRLLVLTSPDRVDGSITDDEAVVNQFTLGGTIGLIFFIALAGVGLAWLYLAARHSLPRSIAVRAAVWAVLLWSTVGSGVFEPEGFDFTQLTPVWLGVLVFSVIFLATGALIAIGVERVVDRWPAHPVAIALPLLPLLPVAPAAALGLFALVGEWMNRRWRAVRIVGALVMVGIFLIWGPPTAANVVRILV